MAMTLKALRANKNLTQKQAAELIGVSEDTWRNYERGYSFPDVPKIIVIEKAFGVSMDTLMRMQNSYDIAQARKREGEIKVAPFKGLPGDSHSAAAA